MKKRPAQTVSERELVFALGRTGRLVGLADLGAWRRCGLLPPFASCGTGAGRSYYWSEPDIVIRALAVHDALAHGGRIDSALIAIWLMGFDVPLTRLRRSWLHRIRVRAASEAGQHGGAAVPAGQSFGAMMELMHSGKGRGEPDWKSIGSRSELRCHLNRLSLLYRPLTENADIIRRSADSDLIAARAFLLGLLSDSERTAAAIATSEPLFLFLLALVRSGQADFLGMVARFSNPASQGSSSKPMQDVRAAS